MDFEIEIKDLKRRVGDLEGAVNVLGGQVGSIHPEIMHLKELTVRSFDTMDGAMSRFVKRLDTMNTQIWSLRDDFPAMMETAVRKAGTDS